MPTGGRKVEALPLEAGADGNRRDRLPLTWRDGVLAEAAISYLGTTADYEGVVIGSAGC